MDKILRIIFIVIAGLNCSVSLIRLIFEHEHENKGLLFSSFAGWACAIIYAMQ